MSIAIIVVVVIIEAVLYGIHLVRAERTTVADVLHTVRPYRYDPVRDACARATDDRRGTVDIAGRVRVWDIDPRVTP